MPGQYSGTQCSAEGMHAACRTIDTGTTRDVMWLSLCGVERCMASRAVARVEGLPAGSMQQHTTWPSSAKKRRRGHSQQFKSDPLPVSALPSAPRTADCAPLPLPPTHSLPHSLTRRAQCLTHSLCRWANLDVAVQPAPRPTPGHSCFNCRRRLSSLQYRMRLRAPIHLSDNSDEDDDTYSAAQLHRSRPSLLPSHSSSFSSAPSRSPRRPSQRRSVEAASPSSTLSWTSPRSAPSLPSPRSSPLPTPPQPPLPASEQRPAAAAAAEANDWQSQAALDVAALRIERRHQRGRQARASDQQQQQQGQHSSARGGKEQEEGGSGWRADGALRECQRDLHELAALADQMERWVSVMRAANTDTRGSGASAADEKIVER